MYGHKKTLRKIEGFKRTCLPAGRYGSPERSRRAYSPALWCSTIGHEGLIRPGGSVWKQ
ncbi:MAG: hypothetical protein JNM14_10630 [Ferruginibacter sp.]|nr:hypothetical protein [Ferruginibacter sp.]